MACRSHFIICLRRYCWPRHPVGRKRGEPIGIWLTQAGDARVRVSKCGGGICGVIVWLREPIDPATGKPQVDDKNPNPALDKRPMIGLPLFSAACIPPGPANGRARSTTPTTAAPTRATSRCRDADSAARRRLRRRALRRRDLDPRRATRDYDQAAIAFSAVAAEA